MNAQQPAAPELPAHMQRVVAEKAEIDAKIQKLMSFMATNTYHDLPRSEQGLLGRQLDAMCVYTFTLDCRIKSAQMAATARSAGRCAGDGQP